ncbi:MAG: RND family efflux transporter MFP subunit [Parcubacteria group bacterium GW2011_GWB1_43_8]|nr:MAG: RND family efflux transporter MFP subunit [Parcubacteria group bacterium GW2011_GWB1_43_8]
MKKNAVYILIGVLAVGWAIYFLFKNGNGQEQTMVVHPGDFIQQVSLSGKVVAEENLDLSFEQTGRVSGVWVKAGDKVFASQILASQDTAQIAAQLAEARAGVDAQNAKLEQLLAGASPEDITVSETSATNAETALANAKVSLDDAKQNLIDKIQDAYTKADDAVLSKTDQMFNSPQSNNPQIIFNSDNQLQTDINWERFLIGSVLKKWKESFLSLSLNDDISKFSKKAKSNLQQIKIFLDKISTAVNNPNNCYNVGGSCGAIPAIWKTDNSAARSNINTALSNLSSAEEKLRTEQSDVKTAEGNLEASQNQLALKKAPARSSDISLIKAQIKQAEANVQNILAQLAKKQIRSPIGGVATAVDLKAGGIVSANENVISIISDNSLQIESYVPEKNIPLVKVGDSAAITLDAYGEGAPFSAKVISIDPAETIRDGVSTYRIKLQFAGRDDRVKPGMTANVLVTTEKKTDVIAVPQGIIMNKNGQKFVKVKEGDIAVERAVETGDVSSLGQVEIISGLKDGDMVVLEQANK